MITFSPVPFLGDYTFGQGSGTFATWGLVDKIAGIASPVVNEWHWKIC
jgi:hypothetical protein